MKPHAVFITLPAQGHVIPMMQLAKLLHSRGFYITFVNSQFNHNRLIKANASSDWINCFPDFKFQSIPDGLPPSDRDATQDPASLSYSLRKNCLPATRDLLNRLRSTVGVPPVSCVISDGLMSGAMKAAQEIGVQGVQLWTASACGFMGYVQFPELLRRGIIPFKVMFRSRRTYEEYMNSLQNEEGAPQNAFNFDIEENNGDDVNVEVGSSELQLQFNPALIPIPEGFNDNEHVLLIDGEGNVQILKGRLTIKKLYSLDASNKIMVPLNKFFQPVKKAGTIFNRFLSDIARRPTLCPLNYKDWRLVPQYFKRQIITYVRAKFMLISSQKVDEKVVSSVCERLRWYKRCLRMKYINEQTTKEDLYNLPAADEGQENELTRPKGVGDAMWHEFVDWCFSEKFKKYSEVGKNARGLVLHTHTCGTATYAVTRDKFVKEHNREPGDVEWFIKTHKKKDNTFLEPITQQFVDSALDIIKRKTGQSEVVFSESTANVESFTYKKLMGEVTKGRVMGYGPGVTAKDLHNTHYVNESQFMIDLMKKMDTMKNEIVELKAKVAEQASQHGSNCNSVEGTRQNGVSPAFGDANSVNYSGNMIDYGATTPPLSKQIVPMSLNGATTPHTAQVSNPGMPIEHGPTNLQVDRIPPDTHIPPLVKLGKPIECAPTNVQGIRVPPLTKQPVPLSRAGGATTPLHTQVSKSGMPIECAPATVQGTRVPPLTKQPVPMSRAGATTPHHALQPSDKRNAEQIQANNGGVLAMGPLKRFKNAELTYQELEKVIDKILMENPEAVKKFIRGDKHKREMSHCHLAGMALYMCKKRANREMLDKLLWVKLNKVANKEHVQEPKLLNASME